MGKRYQGRGGGGRGRGGSRASTDHMSSTGESASTTNYRAPTVGYEDQVFSHGTTKAAQFKFIIYLYSIYSGDHWSLQVSEG